MIELRCPRNAKRLLATIDYPAPGEQRVCIACQSCRKDAQRDGQPGVSRVIHVYAPTGELVDTVTVSPDRPATPRRA